MSVYSSESSTGSTGIDLFFILNHNLGSLCSIKFTDVDITIIFSFSVSVFV